MTVIAEATGEDDIEAVRGLFQDYAHAQGYGRCFAGFQAEIRPLPVPYAVLLLARGDDGEPLGCVGLMALDERTCEMRRLFVRPEARRRGLGRALSQRAMAEAAGRGFRRIVLETLAQMQVAQYLYDREGFALLSEEDGVLHFSRDLDPVP